MTGIDKEQPGTGLSPKPTETREIGNSIKAYIKICGSV